MDKGTPLGQVRGAGSAHEGAGHWVNQRYTAAANLFLLVWLVVSLLLLPGFDYASVSDWLKGLIPSTLASLLIVSLFWHARLGLQVLVEDYVKDEANKFGAGVLLNLLTFGGAALGVMSVLRIAFGVDA